MKGPIRFLLSAILIASTAAATPGQTLPDGTTTGSNSATPHPLSWWTQDPLRLDTDGMLHIGHGPGKVAASHYAFRSKASTIGTLSGHKIVQVITSIYPRNEVISSGWSNVGDPDNQWKTLLVQSGDSEEYVELYRVQREGGSIGPFAPAAIYGSGPDAILTTSDPLGGNGAGCTDGYWRFDEAGAHPVDFSPLLKAINRAIPRNTVYTSNCWAMNPAQSELKAPIQRADAKCHACGWIGEVRARYKIEHGAALPVSVHFTPQAGQ
jgi:hypothetical protein